MKKRYLSTNQIRDEIDRYRAKAAKLNQAADAQEIKARTLLRTGDPLLAEDASFAREQAKKYRKSAARIADVRLVKLKNKLAEFNTNPMLGIIPDGDRSVQA